MKDNRRRDGFQVFFGGMFIWVFVALLIAGGLWWMAGIWPSSGKAWVFILLMSPVIWISLEALGDTFIRVIDFMLPKTRYVNRLAAEKIAEEQKAKPEGEIARWVSYVLHVAIGAAIFYLLWQWLDQKLELPSRTYVVDGIRQWWFANFK